MSERRLFQGAAEYRAGEDKPMIFGVASVAYDGTEATEFTLRKAGPGRPQVVERIMKGAFDKVLAGGPDVRILVNHHPDNLLGRTKARTAKVYVCSRGNLNYVCAPPDTQLGRDVLSQLRRGDLSGSSFAFKIGKENFREERGKGIVEILDINGLYDCGPVTYPAYHKTTAGVRSGNPRNVLERYEIFERAQASKPTSYFERARRAGWQPFTASAQSPLSLKIASYKLRAMAARL